MRTGLLIALLLPFCSAAPLDTNVDAEADRVQDGTHSHRDGNAYIHNKADIDVSFSGNTEFHDLSIGHHMEVNVHGDGGGHIQVCTAGKVNQACFCDNGQEGGQDCAAGQGCTSGGACLDVCTAGKVNQACFCDNGQEGGQDCAAEQFCTSGGACLDVLPRQNLGIADLGIADCLSGWFDVQGQGVNNDYCRWVGDCGCRGHCSWWSCALAGTNALLSPKGEYSQPVCTAGKVNQACFCDNGQEGGQNCAAQQVCTSGGACLDVFPRQNIGIANLGIADCLSGWFDVQGQGVNNDYCRWVGECGCRGHCSWWSCALAGTNALLSPKGEYSQPELPRQQITHDLGIADCLSGWFDVQEQGVNNDYCRWVGDCGCRGHCSWWSCALAGTNAKFSPKGEYSQPVCTAGNVNQACFCDNGQGGGQDCAAEQVCTSGGACLDVTCPGEDGLSSVLLENNWKTQDQINEMTEEQKKAAVIAEVVKITAHTTSDLEGRANAGDLGSLISIANMASLLIKYSIKLSSDVKTMTYKPDLRNALITEISRHPSIQVSTLQSKTDDQLLKTFCKACPADAKITSDCMCGGNSCTEGNVCVAGSTCTPVCAAGAFNSAACFCENAQVGQGGEVCTAKQGCHSDGTCLEVCSRERKKLVSDCICSTIFESVLCSAGNICNQDGMCMEVCTTDGKLEKGCYCGPEIEPCLRGNACLDGICQKKPLFFFVLFG